jgi:arylsulfatase
LADIFNTSLSLAGVPCGDINTLLTEKEELQEVEKHYIDGVDKTPFLLAKDGQSCRRSRIYTLNQFFSAVRIDEFKGSMIVELEDAIFLRGYNARFSVAIVTNTGDAIMTNLYTDTQEDVNVGIRHIPVAVQIGNEIERYTKVLMQYPPKKISG